MQVIKVIIGWEMLSKRIKPRAYRLQKEYHPEGYIDLEISLVIVTTKLFLCPFVFRINQ